MSTRSVTHSSFVIERVFDAPPEQVFRAFADPAIKPQWFHGPDEWSQDTYTLDFRVGGKEHSSGGPVDGHMSAFDCTYYDIVENVRIITAYEMHLDDIRISVSLATTELAPDDRGTRLTYTEHGAYLDDYDDAGSREEGTGWLFDNLEKFLANRG